MNGRLDTNARIRAEILAELPVADDLEALKEASARTARLADLIPGASLDTPNAFSLVPTSGDLGTLLLAFLDAAGFLSLGVTKDGTAAVGKLRALASILTPLLAVPGGGSVALGSGSKIRFDGDGKITGATGATISMQEASYGFAICDSANNVLFGWKGGKFYGPGVVTTATGKRINLAYGTGVAIDMGPHNYDFCVADKNGNVMLGWMNGVFYSPIGATGVVDLDKQDAADKAFTAAVYRRRVTNVQKPVATYNALYMYGQSLAQGYETWPALSRTPKYGNLMLGGNTLGSSEANSFVQFAPTGLQPLVAHTVNAAKQYSDAEEAALAPGDFARGEPPNIGWANGAKARFNDYLVVANAADRSFVTINIAKGGATIGELEKNHTEGTTEHYGKYLTSLTQLGAAAGASSLTIAGLGFMQGEYDYSQGEGHNSQNMTYAAWKAKVTTLAANMQADAITATGQAKPPAFLIYQTGGTFTRDADVNGVPGLHIGMAQLDFAKESDTAWMVGPIYPYTDKGGHLDSNGSRWFGHQLAKVWTQIVVEGRDWEPLRPLRIWQEGTSTIYVAYHVPFAPLVFDEPQIAGGAEYSNASKGFRVTDDAGAVAVISAEIVRDTIIKLTCARALGGNPKVWYASQGTTGNGMVRDSDPAVASDAYVYEPDRGMYASANIPQFVGKPYPLWNWGVAFFLPVGFKE